MGNDLWYNRSPEEILADLKQLHDACHRQGTKTVALAIPPSIGCAFWKQFGELHTELNNALKSWAIGQDDVLGFIDTRDIIPFAMESELWERDGIFFSAEGYNHLGRELAARL